MDAAGGPQPTTAGTGDGVASAAGQGGAAATTGGAATGGSGEPPSPGSSEVPWVPECPPGFEPQDGGNHDFLHEGLARAFEVRLPTDTSTPRPVFVSITGTVESTIQNLSTRGGTERLADMGFIVLGPVRRCSNQDPNDGGALCNRVGSDGWNWEPWNDGSWLPQWNGDVGPDARFLEAMVKCVATKWSVDPKRVFISGISAGGTFTHRMLTFRSEFWAGGVPNSGEWYVTTPAALDADPTAVVEGACCPIPLPRELDAMAPMIVIEVFGGAQDTWPGADYRRSTQAASNYFDTQSNVVLVSCTGTHGHQWPNTDGYHAQTASGFDAFNNWIATVLASHPKGSSKEDFELIAPPAPFACSLGRYTDAVHYGQ